MRINYKPSDKKVLIKIGNNIKKFRKEKNLSQETLAYECGMDRTYVSAVERGERNISILKLKKIADVLKIELISLIMGEKNENC